MGDPLILLLAAGASTRMRGADKLLEPLGDAALIRVMAARCAKAGPTRVVLGPHQPARRAALDGLEVEIVEATGTDGMAASIRAGVEGIKNRAVMIVLADMPEITASDLHLLLALQAQYRAPIVQAATEDGTPGQPVVFAAKFLKALAALEGDEGARSIVKAQGRDVVLVPLPGQRARTDLDTPEDWSAWRAGR
jgi:CTP:molybdopterin cytidylyltransferase MocA